MWLAPEDASSTQRIHVTSWPAASRTSTAARGKFSLARKRISGSAGVYFFRTQDIPRISEARGNVCAANAGIVVQNIGFGPALAKRPIMKSTASRVPLMTGFPASTAGSSVMRAWPGIFCSLRCYIKRIRENFHAIPALKKAKSPPAGSAYVLRLRFFVVPFG